MLKKGQQVSGYIENIFPFGVFCRLEDGSKAYIRQRELTMEGNIAPDKAVNIGEKIEAIVVALAKDELLPELSISKASPDPWIPFSEKMKEGDIVYGKVKYLYPEKVVVQIEPGVDGEISKSELSTKNIKKPEELLWQDDHIEAVITTLDYKNKLMQLSIKRRVEQLHSAGDILTQIQNIKSIRDEVSVEEDEVETIIPRMLEPNSEINLPGKILVLEDHDEVRLPIVQWLKDQGCEVDGFRDFHQAIKAYKASNNYSLILADINLVGQDGIVFLKTIRDQNSQTIFTVMSDPDTIFNRIAELETLNITAAFIKPLDKEEIHQLLLDISHGKAPKLKIKTEKHQSDQKLRAFSKNLKMMRSDLSLNKRMEIVLRELQNETGAELAAIFHFDPLTRLFDITTLCGSLPVKRKLLNNLIFSPVEDVISEGKTIREMGANTSNHEKFKKLLSIVSFESCIGVPIMAQGRCDYALFIFHQEKDFFSRFRLRDAQTSAALIKLAIEDSFLHNHIHTISPLVISGQLTSAFNHEVYNKLTSLDFQLEHLNTTIEKLEISRSENDKKGLQIEEYSKVRSSVDQINETITQLKNMATIFRRLTKSNQQTTSNIKTLIEQICSQIQPILEKEDISLIMSLEDSLPVAKAEEYCIHHALLNLLMNAIQHLQQKEGKKTIKIINSFNQEKNKIEIRILDNGPGIHRKLWQKIFEIGFSTRKEGSGMGLYIARNLMETNGGKIIVEESIINLGTTFLVEIPREEQE